MILVIRRSFPKIRRRVLGFEHLFGKKFIDEMNAWSPDAGDVLRKVDVQHSEVTGSGGGEWVVIPNYHDRAVFKEFSIPKDSDGRFYFHIDTASQWLKAFISVFSSLQASVQSYDNGDEDSFPELYCCLDHLHWITYRLHKYFDAIFSLPSLDRLLESLHPKMDPMTFTTPGNTAKVQGTLSIYDHPYQGLIHHARWS
jgi:hypothetical protein